MCYDGGMGTRYIPLAVISLLALSLNSTQARAGSVSLAADTISVHANRTPLSEILAGLREYGVRVAMDERIDPLVTDQFENMEVSQGIKRILTDCDYAVFFENMEGPAGKLSRLSEVLVYKPGDRRPLKAKPAPPPDVAIAPQATNLFACLRNEILLRLRADTSREQFRELLLRAGATVVDAIPELGIYRLRLPAGVDLARTLKAMTADPRVSAAEPNLVYHPVTTVLAGPETSSAVPRTAKTGISPAVAILDSGFTPNTALEKAVVATLDATTQGQPITDPVGHGTQMAFLASGSITPSGAPAADLAISIIPIRTMDDGGLISGFTLMKSMVFAVRNGARVISMSWGSNGDSALFRNAIAYAKNQGTILVAAAGNEPTGLPMYPAALPDVIAVAALTPDQKMWDRSNYGTFVKLAAPGFANMPIGHKGPPGVYGGTSIAAAYTANVIARYLATHPKATGTDAMAALQKALSQPASGSIHPEIPRLDSQAVKSLLP